MMEAMTLWNQRTMQALSSALFLFPREQKYSRQKSLFQAPSKTPELKDIVQEIIDRPGWAESKIGLVLENYESWHGNTKYCWDYNQDAGAHGAKLLIAWTRERRVTNRVKDTPAFDKANYPEYIIVHHSATAKDLTKF